MIYSHECLVMDVIIEMFTSALLLLVWVFKNAQQVVVVRVKVLLKKQLSRFCLNCKQFTLGAVVTASGRLFQLDIILGIF